MENQYLLNDNLLDLVVGGINTVMIRNQKTRNTICRFSKNGGKDSLKGGETSKEKLKQIRENETQSLKKTIERI